MELQKFLLLDFCSVGDLFPWIMQEEYTIELKEVINLKFVYLCHQNIVTLLKISITKIRTEAWLQPSGSIMLLIIIIIYKVHY